MRVSIFSYFLKAPTEHQVLCRGANSLLEIPIHTSHRDLGHSKYTMEMKVEFCEKNKNSLDLCKMQIKEIFRRYLSSYKGAHVDNAYVWCKYGMTGSLYIKVLQSRKWSEWGWDSWIEHCDQPQEFALHPKSKAIPGNGNALISCVPQVYLTNLALHTVCYHTFFEYSSTVLNILSGLGNHC